MAGLQYRTLMIWDKKTLQPSFYVPQLRFLLNEVTPQSHCAGPKGVLEVAPLLSLRTLALWILLTASAVQLLIVSC